jgi:hypothetical protein
MIGDLVQIAPETWITEPFAGCPNGHRMGGDHVLVRRWVTVKPG